MIRCNKLRPHLYKLVHPSFSVECWSTSEFKSTLVGTASVTDEIIRNAVKNLAAQIDQELMNMVLNSK